MHTVGFNKAIVELKNGGKVARAGWNGKGMFVWLKHAWTYTDGKQDNYPNLPFIAMKTADNCVVPWLASQTDLLSTDWALASEV